MKICKIVMAVTLFLCVASGLFAGYAINEHKEGADLFIPLPFLIFLVGSMLERKLNKTDRK